MVPESAGRAAIKWPARVSKSRIRRLYESIPSGLLDEAMVDDVGISLYMRCRAILTVGKARRGRVLCPVCDKAGIEHYIARQARSPDETVQCDKCGWQIMWSDYLLTIRRRQLHQGGAVPAFERFVDQYPRCRTPWEKMLAIDLVIHEFHFSLPSDPTRPTRAACVNLIEGRLSDVVPFLNELSGMTAKRPELEQNHTSWKSNCVKAGEWHPK